MQNFKMKSFADWIEWDLSETLEFEFSSKSRGIELSFMATAPILLFGSMAPEFTGDKLLATGDGFFDMSVSVDGTLYLRAQGPSKARLFVRGKSGAQLRPQRPELRPYTDLSFTPAPIGADYERIMRAMNANADARMATMEAEIKRLRDEAAAVTEG